MRELSPGIWHWQAPHPEWRSSEPWNQNVSSYAIDDGERLLVFDPIAPPDELFELAADRDTAIVLTSPWHERDMQSLVERVGVPVYAPRPDSAQDLMDKFGITAEHAGDGSPDLVWLRAEAADHWRPYAVDGPFPSGVEAYEGREPNDLVLWVESHRAVVAGDTLADFGERSRGLGPLAPRGRDARVTGRAPASAPRQAGRARARDARRPVRSGRARARTLALLAAATVTRAEVLGRRRVAGHSAPPGLLFHASGPIDGWGIIDFWESRADFDVFLETRIQPGMAAAGLELQGPYVKEFPVHEYIPS